MSETLTIEIDGKQCTCQAGEYLYDVAKRNGIFIPTLCRSDAFPDHRACCRICIVEVEIRGRSKVVTSCVYPVEAACVVRTNSEKIREERAVIYALLQARAPEAAGIAALNSLAAGSGFERLAVIDGSKCILCGLCVQACNSLGTGAISTVNRGTDKKIDTPYDKASPSCVGCLSCAHVCPTDAIPFEEGQGKRVIWNRAFDLVYCQDCGAVMGTRESVEFAAAKTGAETMPTVCDACRKQSMADQMMATYRFV
jgi:bidirectional [NiFe] hydrogenase diaphorase subunit